LFFAQAEVSSACPNHLESGLPACSDLGFLSYQLPYGTQQRRISKLLRGVKNLQEYLIDHQQFTKNLENIFSLPPPFFPSLEVTFRRKFLALKIFPPNQFSRCASPIYGEIMI
jgi:hypothetical protein